MSLITQLSFSQNKEVVGVSMSMTEVIPFMKIIFIDSTNHVVTGVTSDIDGIFKLSLSENNYSKMSAVCKTRCMTLDTIRDLHILNDTLKLNFSSKNVDCKPKLYNNCPYNDAYCEVYRSADLFTNPYDKIDGKVTNDSNQNIPIKIRQLTYSNNGCCINTWYCKTHDVDY